MIGTLAVDGWAVTFDTARRGVVNLEHGPYKTASDTLASRFVASDNLDVT